MDPLVVIILGASEPTEVSLVAEIAEETALARRPLEDDERQSTGPP